MLKTATATAPSNIALIKYWGKSDATINWPANDSLSMTLSRARTITTARVNESALEQDQHSLAFSGHESRRPTAKTVRFLEWLRYEIAHFGQAKGALEISTQNTFPSSCGIASSASGYAALTMAAAGAWLGINSIAGLESAGITRDLLAKWARRGSGSACRSISGGFVYWERGKAPEVQSVKTIFAPAYWPLADLIVLIDQSAKHVSSSEGHARAFTSPMMLPRLESLPGRLQQVAAAIESRDLEKLGDLIENEATEMHDIMKTSTPRTEYFGAPTVQFLDWLRQCRRSGDFHAWFTLDAGPNPHLLCRPEDSTFIRNKILANFPGTHVMEDLTGDGASFQPGGTANGH
jgi:diphosphomevalonate decarboxylase